MSAPRPLMFPEQVSAGFGRRLAALSIDWFASLGVAVLVFRQYAYGSADSMIATVVVFFAEIVLFTFLLGASFGQKILGLRVVSVQGGRLPLWRIAVRTFLILLVIPALVLDSDGRGLHDRLLGSQVVRVS
ncbi:MAG: RDD family protein [Candidatus Nanopelagicales bacterium]|nr:RDD family protein [Candidatus Nanopelagicales bacterium]